MSKDLREVEYLSTLFMPDTTKVLTILQQICIIVLGWSSVTLEVFTRRNFGERYLSWMRLFLAWFAMGFFDFARELPALFQGMIPFGQRTYVSHINPLFWQGFIVIYLIHRFHIWQRNRQGVQWHSQSFGLSWLESLPWHLLNKIPVIGRFIVIDDWMLYLWIEPALCFGVGFILRPLIPGTSAWISFATLALFVKNQMVYFATRNRFMDVIDARIEAANLTGALAGKSKRDTAGFSVIPVPMGNDVFRSIPDIASAVQDTLRR